MVGGATPPADGSALILSLRRLNALRAIEPGFAIAEAGVILENLHDAAADTGQRFPLTLGAKGSATVGGLVSTNAGGTQVLRFGPMRALVEGIEAVLPDGSIHHGLTGLKKDNRGPSLDQLLIGAEGTLGIVTAARLRLVPAIASRSVAWLGLASPAAALAVLRALQAATDRVEGFEILPDESLGAALDHIPGTRAPLAGRHPWYALVEATSDDDVPRRPRRLARAAGRARAGRRRRDRLERSAGGGDVAHPRQPVGGRARRLRPRHPARHLGRGRRHARLPRQRRRRGRDGLPRHPRLGLRPPRRRQYPFPRPRRMREAGRTGSRAKARRSRAWSTTSSPRQADRSAPSTASAR